VKKQVVSTIDVLPHELNPQMEVVSESEKGKVQKKFGINNDQFPRVFLSDPAVVSLKAKVGDVIKIKRNDGTGDYLAYRIVVEG
jgi:DNA-directed RNA polymerase subunit H